MRLRRTIAWTLFLLLIAAVAGGAYVWRLWKQADQMLQSRIQQVMDETVPDWNVELDKARFDMQGQIRLQGVKVGPDTQDRVANLPETVVSVDREQLLQQNLVIHQVKLLAPELDFELYPDGTWNWQALSPPSQLAQNSFEWKIERGKIRLHLVKSGTTERSTITLHNINLQLTPAGVQRFVVRGSFAVDPIGVVHIDGYWHLDEKTWLVNGRVDKFTWDDTTVRQLCQIWPSAMPAVRGFCEEHGIALSSEGVPQLGLYAETNLVCRFEKTDGDSPVRFRWLAKLLSGELNNPLAVLPWTNLQGRIYGDSEKILVPNFSARSDQTRCSIEKLRWDFPDPDQPLAFETTFQNLPLNESVREQLPENLQELYDEVEASGQVDVKAWLHFDLAEGWTIDSDLMPQGCSAAYFRFPYPVYGIRGLIEQRGKVFKLNLKGKAADQDITLTGEVRSGQDEPGAVLDVNVKSLPLDERLWEAAPAHVQGALKSLQMTGVGDFHYRTVRRGASPAPWEQRLFAAVRDASVTCRQFPYAVRKLTGIVEWDGATWDFKDLRGSHQGTQLQGEAHYRQGGNGGVLDLTVHAEQGEFDEDLRDALPDRWQHLWTEISPQGQFQGTAGLIWSPQQPLELTLDLQLDDAAFNLRSFAYPFSKVQGQVTLHAGRVHFTDITGQHDETRMRLKSGWALEEPEGWRVRLDDLLVEDLIPDSRFRRALPDGFRQVIDSLDPRSGLINVHGMLEFRGTGHAEDPVTAAWDVELLHTDVTVTTGVDLEHMYGKVSAEGTWDGQTIISHGRAQLDSLSILGYQFAQVKGPVSINGSQLVIGAKDIVNAAVGNLEPPRVALEDRISGRAINGTFTLDGIAVLGLNQETSYRVFISMNDARLERYAELYLPQQHNLRGVMNGWADLSGRGNSARQLTGRGQLRIRPAALYELPVMLAVLKVFQGISPDKTAFDEAFSDFEVKNSRIELNRLDLIGNALTLRGHGWVRFDRRLQLDFYSTQARQRLGIPIFSQVWGQATEGLIGVEVRGSLDRPVAEFRPAPKLDEALRRFLGTLEPRPINGPTGPFGRLVPGNRAGETERQR